MISGNAQLQSAMKYFANYFETLWQKVFYIIRFHSEYIFEINITSFVGDLSFFELAYYGMYEKKAYISYFKLFYKIPKAHQNCGSSEFFFVSWTRELHSLSFCLSSSHG